MFTKTTLEGTKAGTLQSSKEEVEQHLSETHSDENQWKDLGHCDRIEKVPEPVIPMDTKEPSTWKEIVNLDQHLLRDKMGFPTRNVQILKHLWRLLKGKIPPCWQQAQGCFIAKEESRKTTISLLNVEGKIFFSVLSRRMTSYMTGNSYVDTFVQKGGVPRFSGCVEHTSVIS